MEGSKKNEAPAESDAYQTFTHKYSKKQVHFGLMTYEYVNVSKLCTNAHFSEQRIFLKFLYKEKMCNKLEILNDAFKTNHK